MGLEIIIYENCPAAVWCFSNVFGVTGTLCTIVIQNHSVMLRFSSSVVIYVPID